MGSLSISEILTILVVILIIFGPSRLPELARRLGELLAKAREATSSFTKQLEAEYGDAIEPISGLKDQFDGIKKDITEAVTTIGNAASIEPASPAEDAEEEQASGDDQASADEPRSVDAPDEGDQPGEVA